MKSYYIINRYEIGPIYINFLLEEFMNSSSNISKEYSLLTSELDSIYHEAAFKLGVSDSAMWIMYALGQKGGSCSLRDIVILSGISKQTINSAVRKMESEEILYLENIDARRKNVCLTEKGKALAARSSYIVMQMEEDIFKSWSKEDAELLIRFTKQFVNDLTTRVRRL